jgi:hypothetical protein
LKGLKGVYMNVVHAGSTYQIYGEALKTYDKLPVRSYEVGFSKMSGFFLTAHNNLVVNEEKIYGSTPKKVEKVLRAFEATDRNFGVILSGKKGIGKSLFARLLANKAIDYDLPLIIVSEYIPGIANFLSSIEQEVIVFFDEFEKTFGSKDDGDPQEEMLSLFDGVDGGKKLFVITCNEISRLNSYLLNRPGRFHYHFILGNPNPDEIKEYMTDKLKPEYHYHIKRLIGFSMNVDLTYDVLRAIAFELNMGYSFEETLMDLNIGKEESPKYTIRIEFVDGTFVETQHERLNLYSSDKVYQWFTFKGKRNISVRFDFSPSDVNIDFDKTEMTIDPRVVNRYVDEDYFNMDRDEDKQLYEYLNNIEISKMIFTREVNEFAFKYCL